MTIILDDNVEIVWTPREPKLERLRNQALVPTDCPLDPSKDSGGS